jgi:membrane-anchored protein YejM (alkaline phosphatase superfamily)
MDERIFGENHQLADQIFDFSEERVTHQSDSNAIEKLLEEMRASKGNGGHLHIISLDSTHFDYSWPKETGSLFLPVKEEIDYFKAAYSKSEMEGIKNRYRNAIHHVDSLLGRFFEELKKQGKDKDALVVVTGDHGQEFFEDEHLFHASTLNAAQTQVPIYYKFGDGSKLPSRGRARLTSHIDIFPTLLHYICQKDLDLKVIQGESIFKDEKWAYVISARYNGSKKPTEFFIHNGKNKITLRFNEKDIFHSSQLSILSVKDLYDKNIPHDKSTIRGEFGGAFNRLFSTQ